MEIEIVTNHDEIKFTQFPKEIQFLMSKTPQFHNSGLYCSSILAAFAFVASPTLYPPALLFCESKSRFPFRRLLFSSFNRLFDPRG